MVTAVKKDGKVGLAYMKSFEIEARIREEALAEGKAEGLAEGKSAGIGESILDLLGDLGEIPFSLREKIAAQRDTDTLRTWLKCASRAESVEDFMQRISN